MLKKKAKQIWSLLRGGEGHPEKHVFCQHLTLLCRHGKEARVLQILKTAPGTRKLMLPALRH